MLLRAVTVVALMALLVTPALAQKAQDTAPNELPTHLIKVLRTSDKAQTNRYVPKVYDLKNVNPYAVARWIRTTTQQEEGLWYFFGKPDQDGIVRSGKVLVGVPKYMLPGIDEMMRVIDRKDLTTSSGEPFFYYKTKWRSVEGVDSELFKMLRDVAMTNAGVIRADVPANAVWVQAAPSAIASVQRTAALLDLPPAQVMIEVTVYEIALNNISDIGLDYVQWKNGPGKRLLGVGAYYEYEKITNPAPPGPLLATGTGDTYGLPGHRLRAYGNNCAYFLSIPSAFLDFLVVKGKAKVMTAAKVAARHNTTATLKANDSIFYYKTVQETGFRGQRSPTDPLPAVDREVQEAVLSREESGVFLKVTPVIGEKDICIDVKTETRSHTGFKADGAPVIATQKTDTKLVVQDGEEVVLGGYTHEAFIQRGDKVPVLGSLPVIGWLFGGEGNTTEKRQVFMVLKTHRIRDYSHMECKDTNIKAALIKDRALRKAKTRIPRTEAGFDQWLLDPEKD